jgi:hypothetical protein
MKKLFGTKTPFFLFNAKLFHRYIKEDKFISIVTKNCGMKEYHITDTSNWTFKKVKVDGKKVSFDSYLQPRDYTFSTLMKKRGRFADHFAALREKIGEERLAFVKENSKGFERMTLLTNMLRAGVTTLTKQEVEVFKFYKYTKSDIKKLFNNKWLYPHLSTYHLDRSSLYLKVAEKNKNFENFKGALMILIGELYRSRSLKINLLKKLRKFENTRDIVKLIGCNKTTIQLMRRYGSIFKLNTYKSLTTEEVRFLKNVSTSMFKTDIKSCFRVYRYLKDSNSFRVDKNVLGLQLLHNSVFLYRETIMMAEQLGKVINVTKDTNFQKLHDRLMEELNLFKENLDSKPFVTESPLNDVESEELVVKRLNSPAEVKIEGKEMHHCVGSYADTGNNGKWFFFKMSTPERATIQIEKKGDELALIQAFGPCNQPVQHSTRTLIENWMKN